MLRRVVSGLLLVATSPTVSGAEHAPGLGLGDAELALFEDIPVVVSGSRRADSVLRSPVPVSVVSRDEIRYGMGQTIGDYLIFVPGMDVVRVDRSHEMIGVRGLHDIFSDRTLTLVDGIVADNAIYGGSDWTRLPLNTQDIASIEVVRGPGGAAWGANAFNGVINVRTLTPEDALGARAGMTSSAFGDVNAQARWASFHGPLAWRMSFGYEDVVSSQEALDDSAATDTDWRRSATVDGALSWAWTSTTTLDLHLGYRDLEQGELVLLNLPAGAEVSKQTLRGDATLTQEIDERSRLTLRGFGNWNHTDDTSQMNSGIIEQGGIAQVDLDRIGDHQLTFGGDLRWTHISDRDLGGGDRFDLTQTPTAEYRGGLFLIDRWSMGETLSLETQVRGDHYSGTGSDWSGRLAATQVVAEDHSLRLALARAHRTPLSALRSLSTDTGFIAPGVPLVTFRSADVENEDTIAVEAGWQATAWDSGMLRCDAYYQFYNHLIGYDTTLTPTGFPGINTLNIVPATIGDAQGYGTEIEIAQRHDLGRIAVWYAWNAFETDPPDTSIRAFEPAEHKCGVNSLWRLPLDLLATFNYRYGSSHSAPGTERTVPGSHRLDLACTWIHRPAHLELAVGVQDLLDDTPNGVSLFIADNGPQPGRTFFLRAFADF